MINNNDNQMSTLLLLLILGFLIYYLTKPENINENLTNINSALIATNAPTKVPTMPPFMANDINDILHSNDSTNSNNVNQISTNNNVYSF